MWFVFRCGALAKPIQEITDIRMNVFQHVVYL